MGQGIEDDDLVQPVQQLRPEVLPHLHKHTDHTKIQNHIADQGSFKNDSAPTMLFLEGEVN
jgi:hypothetical protein